MIVHLDHPNAQQVRRTAIALGGLLNEVVFVGGQMVPFFITDRGLHRMRPTEDVDVVVECRTRQAYHEFAQRLHAVGFRVDQSPGAPVCRYRTPEGLVLDAMPLDEEILGFSNQWYPLVMDTAVSVDLTDDLVIRAAHPAALLATKWEAFIDRGRDDPYGSHDLEDLLMLIAGRHELAHELPPLSLDVRTFIADSARMLLVAPWFDDVLEGTFPDAQRLPDVLVRIRERIAELAR
ncbi:MAG: nucleotidyl transferase AbiEii/AbiGii toxin family protein [Gemmatimonadaceae bacterium]|nr:nucleotidyl transferase AbiEii/AbiGii toxin family protein [Gemmatimonadaceae bacterium]